MHCGPVYMLLPVVFASHYAAMLSPSDSVLHLKNLYSQPATAASSVFWEPLYVEAPDKSSGKHRQSVHIKYDGMDFIPLDELMKGAA